MLSKTTRIGLRVLVLFSIIAAVAWTAVFVDRTNTSFGIEKGQWFQCTHINMPEIHNRMRQALSDHPEWASDISIPFLVKKDYLPKWSEIYICPAYFDITFNGTRVFDDDFRQDLEGNSLIAANYEKTPYYIEVHDGKATVRCKHHKDVSHLSCAIREKGQK